MPDHAIADGAEHGGFSARALQAQRDPLCDGGFSVGAGDACHPQRVRWVAVDVSGDLAGAAFQIGYGERRHFPLSVPHKFFRVVQHSRHNARDRVIDKVAAISRSTWVGKECSAASGLATVGSHVDNLSRQRDERSGELDGCKVRPKNFCGRHRWRFDHQPRSLATTDTGALASRKLSASGETPDMRSACEITVEKTGADTSPPKCFPAEGSSTVIAMM